MAASLPAPGPFTRTSTVRSPWSIACLAALSPARWAAKAVDFLDPLKPIAPALLAAMALPAGSVSVMIVLLKVAVT